MKTTRQPFSILMREQCLLLLSAIVWVALSQSLQESGQTNDKNTFLKLINQPFAYQLVERDECTDDIRYDRSFSNIFDRLIKLDSNGDVVRILAFEEAENVTLQRGSDESPDIAVWTATLGFSRDGETQIRERVLIEFKLFSEEIDEYVESNYLLGADQFITVQGNSIFFSITLEDFGQGDIFEKVELNIDMLYNKTEFDTDDEIVPNSLDDIDFVELVAEDTFSAVKTIFQIPEVLDPTISFASDRQLLLTMTLDCNDQDCFDSFEAFVEYELSKSLDFLECDDAPLAVQIALPIFVLTVLFISLLILTIVYIILRKVREVNPD